VKCYSFAHFDIQDFALKLKKLGFNYKRIMYSTGERVDDMYNPFDLTLGCSSCEPSVKSFDFFENFDCANGNPEGPSSTHAPFSDTSRRPTVNIFDEGIQANQGTTSTPSAFLSNMNATNVPNVTTTSWQQTAEKRQTQLPPHDAMMHSTVVSLGSISGSLDDDAEETYRAGLIGDHGELTRPSFTPVMSLQQAMALAAEKEVGTSGTSTTKAPPRSNSNRKESYNSSSLYSSGNKSTTDIVLENLKQRTPPRKITTVCAMSAKEAEEKFKSKFGDPAAEKKRMKEMANASTSSSSSSKQTDPKQHPGWPKWNSDPIRGALAKPPPSAVNTRVQQSSTIRPKPRVIHLHSFV
jgi:hypothetical protein